MIEKTELALERYVVIGLDGNIKVVEQGQSLYPGEVVVETLEDETFSSAYVIEEEGKTDVSSDIAAVIDALQQGIDPTQLGEEYATAAGQSGGSSLITSGTIDRTGAETLASTFFETTGFSSEQSSSLFDYLADTFSNSPIPPTPAVITPQEPGDDEGAVQEDVTLSTSGNLNVTDPNAGEAVFNPQTDVQDGNYGSFTIDADGNWTYTLNNNHPDVQALDADSDPVVRTIQVSTADGTTHDVVVTITGSDDKAIITPNEIGDDKGAVQEDVTLSTSGNLNVTDLDAGEAVFNPQTDVQDGNYGSFTIDADGNWTYTLNNNHPDVQALDADSDPVVRNIQVSTADGTTHDVVVTITGSDDKAIITPNEIGDDKGAVQEDVTLSTSGNLNVTDPDAGEAVFNPQTDVQDGNYGSFTIDADGNWTYTLNNNHPDVQALDADSDPVVRTIQVSTADGTTHDVVVTITGSDDKAIITPNEIGDDKGAVQEDVTLSTSGNLNVTDPDAGEAVFNPQTDVQDGNYGSFTIDADGNWTYTLNNNHPDVQALDADSDPVVRTIQVSTADGTTHDVVVTIKGSSDAPEFISGTNNAQGLDDQGNADDDSYSFNVDENLSGGQTLGTVNAFDVDTGDTLTYTLKNHTALFDIDSKTGVVTVKAGVSFDHEAKDSYQLDVEVADSQGLKDAAQVNVAINDLNEAPEFISGTNNAHGLDDQGNVDDDSYSFNVDENLSGGQTLGTVKAFDADANDTLRYSLKTHTDLFEIDSTTGVVSVKRGVSFDDEAKGAYQLGVEVADSQGLKDTTQVNVAINDLNEAPEFISGTNNAQGLDDQGNADDDSYSFNVDENLAGGQTLGTVKAFDADANDTLTYILKNHTDLFDIDSKTGVVTVKAGVSFDHESKNAYQLDVEVADSKGLKDTAQVNVTINDLNEAPEFISGSNNAQGLDYQGNIDDDSYSFNVDENLAGSQTLGTVKAFDADDSDTLTYTLKNHTDLFEIDSKTGVVSVKAGVSFDDEVKEAYQLDVEVADSKGLKDAAQVNVAINDLNEAPEFISGTNNAQGLDDQGNIDIDSYSFNVDENLVGGQTLGAVKAFDADVNDTLTYTLKNHTDLFEIDSKTGEVSVKAGVRFDHESKDAYQLDVEVADSKGLKDTAQVNVAINDLNEAPEFISGSNNVQGLDSQGNIDDDSYSFNVNENLAGGQMLGTVKAFDADVNDTLTYTLKNHTDLFEINSKTGVVSVKAGVSFDDEVKEAYQLNVEVVDSKGLKDTAQVNITINDVNEAPEFISGSNNAQGLDDQSNIDDDSYSFNVDENLAGGQTLGTVKAFDADANDTLTYTLKNHTDLFEIDSKTGVVSVKVGVSFDHEAKDAYQLDVDVADSKGLKDTAQVNVAINDLNEAPEFISGTNNAQGLDELGNIDDDRYSFNVDENLAGGQTLGKVKAFDADDSDTLTYTLKNHTDLFDIDSKTGAVSVKAGVSFDHEAKDSYQLDVEVADLEGIKDTAQVDVAINDINEAPVAIDDKGITTETKTLNSANWDSSDDIKVDYYVIDTNTGAKVADADKVEHAQGSDYRFGVSSTLDSGTDGVKNDQLGYDDATKQSEAMRFSFADGQLSNHVEVDVKNLWSAIKDGGWEPGTERGVWKAYYQGEVVATGVFEGTGKGSQTVTIDANGRYFDSVEMSTIGYKDGVVDPQGSEYFITEVNADLTTFDDTYHTHATGTLTIDVLANDSDPENDDLTIIDYPQDGYLTLQDGKLVFDSAKYLSLLPKDQQELKTGEVKTVEFEYQIEDADGLTDTAKVTVTLIGEVISISDAQVTLHESLIDSGSSVEVQGDLNAEIGSAESELYQFSSQQSLDGLTSGGEIVVFEVSDDQGTLIGYTTGPDASRVVVLQATIDSDTGHYHVEQFMPLDHSQQGADKLELGINVMLKVGIQTDSAILNLQVIDSVPETVSHHHVINDVDLQTNTVVIALDASESMDEWVKDDNGDYITRWDLAQNSIITMFDKYDELGDVKFRIATHAGAPDGQVSEWLDSTADIEAFFSTVSPGAWTPYYQAIEQINGILTEPSSQDVMAGTNNQLYFISDGKPSDFTNWTTQNDSYAEKARLSLMKGVTVADFESEQRYQDLLDGRVAPSLAEEKIILEHAMENAISVGDNSFSNIWSLGVGSDASLEYLKPVATDNGSAIVVTDDAKISEVLVNTVSGQLQSDISDAHGGEIEWVDNVTIGGDTYSFDKSTGSIVKTDSSNVQSQFSDNPLATIDTDHGCLTVNFENGWYDYKAENVSGHQQEVFHVQVIDSDGDKANSEIVIDIKDRAPEFISPNDADQVHGTNIDGTPTNDSISFDVSELEAGLLVGKVAAFDPDGNDTVSYKLVNGDESTFKVNSTTGEIWLREDAKLDFDAQQQHQLTIEASDGSDSDQTQVTLNVIENNAPSTTPVQGYAEVEQQPINKLTVVFDFSSSMTRTFDGTNTVRDQSLPDEVLASREESRAYKAAEALHDMVEKMIAEGGDSNTYVRLVKFAGEATKESWYELSDIEYMTRPPELNGRQPTDLDYRNDVNEYVNNWCWIDSRGLNTDYSQALETVMAPSSNWERYPWQDGLDENGEFDWDLLNNEQPIESHDTVFFISDGAPNPKEDSVPAEDLDQRWQDYIKDSKATVYGIGIATEGDPKVAEAMDELSHEVVYVDSGENLSQYLNHISPAPVVGELLAGSQDADGDVLTISLDDNAFTLLGADLQDVNVEQPVVSSSEIVDGRLHIETVFGTLEVTSNGSYSFTQSETFVLQDEQKADLNFLFKVSDGKGGESDNVFTLTLSGNSDEQSSVSMRSAVVGDHDANILLGTDTGNILLGQYGEDSLDGGAGNDILVGGDGNDILIGGLGNDILTGGAGQDTFTFNEASLSATGSKDVIKDFHLGEDKLDLGDILSSDSTVSPMDNLLGHINAKFDGEHTLDLTVTTDSGSTGTISMETIDLSGLDLSASSTSNEIVDQLFHQQMFKVD